MKAVDFFQQIGRALSKFDRLLTPSFSDALVYFYYGANLMIALAALYDGSSLAAHVEGPTTLGQVMAAHITHSATASIRFWNMKSAGVFVAAVFSLAAALSLQHGLAAVLNTAISTLARSGLAIVPVALLGVYCLQAAYVLLTGVVLIEGEIIFPRVILANLPFFVSGRVRAAHQGS